MTEGKRQKLRPFPVVWLAFSRDGVHTQVREHIALARGSNDEEAPFAPTTGFGPLERILEAAALRHADLSREISEHEGILADARSRLRLAQMFIVRLFTADHIRSLAEKGQSSITSGARAREEREAGKVEVHFWTDTAATITYAALARAFEDLAGSSWIWDAKAFATNGETTSSAVSFSVGPSDIVACREDVLLAPGGGAWSLQFFPGFVLLREVADAVVIGYGDVELEVTRGYYVARGALPGDAKVVGEESTEEDGTASKRPFPVVEYGEMKVKTTDMSLNIPSGQLAAHVVSNYAKARVFVEAYEDHKCAIAAIIEPERATAKASPPTTAAPAQPPLDIKPRDRLWADCTAIALLVFLIGLPFVLRRPAAPSAAPIVIPIVKPIASSPVSDVLPAKAKARSSARSVPKPKRASRPATVPGSEVGEPCSFVRQTNGVLKFIPCAPAGTAPPNAQARRP